MKNKIPVVLLCVSIVLNMFMCYNMKNRKLELLYNMEDLTKIVDGIYPDIVLIDLRDKADYEKGHIKGFINIPSSDGIDVNNYVKKNGLGHKYIYLMCYYGKRAAAAADALQKKGYMHIVYITFGYDEYSKTIQGFVPEKGECDCLAE